ncbi:hypothetical protein D3C81_1920410 [compost metagenome]
MEIGHEDLGGLIHGDDAVPGRGVHVHGVAFLEQDRLLPFDIGHGRALDDIDDLLAWMAHELRFPDADRLKMKVAAVQSAPLVRPEKIVDHGVAEAFGTPFWRSVYRHLPRPRRR